MDDIDVGILNILQLNSRTPIKEISKQVSLSAPSVKERINKMIDSGLIKEFTAVLDPRQLGKNLTAFMFLTLKKPNKNIGFLNMVENETDVLACYYLTGDFDYMIQIVTEDALKLERVLSKIKSTQEVARTRTIIALSTQKDKHSVAP